MKTMKEQPKNLSRLFLPLAFLSLMLVVLFCDLSLAMEAESRTSSAGTVRDGNRPIPLLPDQPGVPICQQTQNLVLNPGFEQISGMPDSWYEGNRDFCNYSYDDPGPDSVVSAQVFAASRARDCMLFTHRIDEIPVESGRTYDYAAQVRADLSQGNAYLRVTFWSGLPGDWNYEGMAYTTRVTDTQEAWIEVTGSVTAPTEAEYARMEATLPASAAGSVWFDDVFFGLATCLDIHKRDEPDPVAPGEALTYTIVYSNTGREQATNVEVIETFDDYVDFESADPIPDRGDTVWEIPELLPGTSGTIMVVVRVEDDIEESVRLSNTVEIISDETLANPLSATTDTTVFSPLKGVDIKGPASGVRDTPYAFAAVVSPTTTTPPIAYTWSPAPVEGQGAIVTYTWSTLGNHTITVVAANAGGRFTDTHDVLITDATVAPADVTITGPQGGIVWADYTFIANVNPDTVTPPITYVWQASGHDQVTHTSDSPSDAVTFGWSKPGIKTVTVTATNAGGTVSSDHSITIVAVPLQSAHITGPTTGNVNTAYAFTTTVGPETATLPVTYTWEIQGQAPVTHRLDSFADVVNLVWAEPGDYTITVTAQNLGSVISSAHTIAIEIPADGVDIIGPTSGSVHTDYVFTAVASPFAATRPFDYSTWSPTPESGQGSASATYNWPVSGPQTIAVTATSVDGTFSDTHSIDIGASYTGLDQVNIDGPPVAEAHVPVVFTATVSPPTATPPFTYTWRITGQDDGGAVATTNATSHTAAFTWSSANLQTVVVTVTNDSGDTAADFHLISIRAPELELVLYFPLVMCQWP
jgi:uncharacterized repeat protein (TIGR01451 family)